MVGFFTENFRKSRAHTLIGKIKPCVFLVESVLARVYGEKKERGASYLSEIAEDNFGPASASRDREAAVVGHLYLLGRDDWSNAEKCWRLAGACLVVSVLAVVSLVYARGHLADLPFLDPRGLDLQILASYVAIAAWAVVFAVAWICRLVKPETTTLAHAVIQLFAITNTFFAYMMGFVTNPYGVICLLGGAAVAMPLLGRGPCLIGIASAAVLVISLSFATAMDWIPYAPLMASAPYVDQKLSPVWLYGWGIFYSATLAMIFSTYFRVLTRWHRREDRLRRAHHDLESLADQLARAKGSLEQRIFERTAELEHAHGEILRSSAERGRISLELRSLNEAMESAIEGVARVDGLGRVQSLNASFSEMHGVPVSKLRGRPADDLVDEADRRAVQASLRQIPRTGKAEHDVRALRGDGTVFYQNLVLINDPSGGEGAHFRFARDVTAQHQMQEQLTQAQKMDALGRLAGGIAHDFNNILTSMLLTTEQLRGAVTRGEKGARSLAYVDWLNDAAQRASDLTRQLLDFSRRDESGDEWIDVNAAIAKLAAMLRATLGVDVSIELDLDPGHPMVKGDFARFETSLMNLALNARDAMPEGGAVTFAVRRTLLQAGDPLLAAFGIPVGEYVRIDVRDEGVGIDPSATAKIFEPFYTTKEVGKGTGLGLSLVYTYLRETGGAIRVESDRDTGTTMSLFVPVSQPNTASSPRDAVASSGRPGHGTILLAEDDASVAGPMEQALREAGYDVWLCGNGLEAVDLYKARGQEVDLVVLDLRMPILNGAEAYLEMRRIDPTVRAVVVSGNVGSDDLYELERKGLLGALRKPFRERDLLEFVSGAMSPGVATVKGGEA